MSPGLKVHLRRLLFMLWENSGQFINSHLRNLLENLGPRDDPCEKHDSFFILVSQVLIWSSPICQVSTVTIRIIRYCLVLSFSQTYALLNLHYHTVTLPRPSSSAPYILVSLISSSANSNIFHVVSPDLNLC